MGSTCRQWSRNSTGLFASELCLPNLETLVIAFTYEAMESHHILSLFNHAPALKQVTFYRPLEPEEHLGAYAFIPAKDKFDRLLLPTLCLVKQGAEIFPNILSNVNQVTLLRLHCLETTRVRHSYRPDRYCQMYVFPNLVGLSISENIDNARRS